MIHRPISYDLTRRTLIAALTGSVAYPLMARAAAPPVGREAVAYTVPAVTLTDASGKQVALRSLMAGTRPIVLEFFYTSCTTICGLQSSALSDAQAALDSDCTMISISMDPEFDTPARLRQYAASFAAKPNWHLLTGKREDILHTLSAFDARPLGDNKMFHQPYVFIRVAPDREWLRLEGLMDGPQLVSEFKDAMAHPPPRRTVRTEIETPLRRWLNL